MGSCIGEAGFGEGGAFGVPEEAPAGGGLGIGGRADVAFPGRGESRFDLVVHGVVW